MGRISAISVQSKDRSPYLPQGLSGSSLSSGSAQSDSTESTGLGEGGKLGSVALKGGMDSGADLIPFAIKVVKELVGILGVHVTKQPSKDQ